MKLSRRERFELDLLDSGMSYGVVLKETVARQLLSECHNYRAQLDYKLARDRALENALVAGQIGNDEWNAYKDFIDRRFLRRAHEALRIKHRPFAPLDAA